MHFEIKKSEMFCMGTPCKEGSRTDHVVETFFWNHTYRYVNAHQRSMSLYHIIGMNRAMDGSDHVRMSYSRLSMCLLPFLAGMTLKPALQPVVRYAGLGR